MEGKLARRISRILCGEFDISSKMYCSVVAAVGIGVATAVGSVAAGSIEASAAKSAANTEAGAEENATQIQYQEFLQQQANLQPWLTAGTGALSTLQTGIQPGGQFNTPYTSSMFQQSDQLKFAEQQGDQAINNNAAAKGMSYSPATSEALSAYNVNQSMQYYGQAYNEYMGQESQAYNEMAGLAGVGQSATQQLNQAGGTYSAAAASNTIGAGNALAAGTVAAGNDIGGAINQAGNNLLSSFEIGKLLSTGS